MKESSEFECVSCGGRGCEKCNDTGVWTFDGCPHEIIERKTWTTLHLIDLATDGLWPMAGGSLDQTEWFMKAFSYMAREMKWAETT